LIASSDLLALAPLLAAPFLMGGISLDLYLATIVCLPAVLLFCTRTAGWRRKQDSVGGTPTEATGTVAPKRLNGKGVGRKVT
jgi:hypothetical protein